MHLCLTYATHGGFISLHTLPLNWIYMQLCCLYNLQHVRSEHIFYTTNKLCGFEENVIAALLCLLATFFDQREFYLLLSGFPSTRFYAHFQFAPELKGWLLTPREATLWNHYQALISSSLVNNVLGLLNHYKTEMHFHNFNDFGRSMNVGHGLILILSSWLYSTT